MKIKEMIEKLRYKANNIKAHIEPEFFNDVADVLEKYQWIDVRDRMPEEDKEVLICSQWGTIDVGWHYDTYWATEHNTYEEDGDIVAWMPLPEPYKLPKKKKFTDDELCILRNIKSEINTLGRNINGTIYVTSDYGKSYLKLFNNLFQSLDIGEEIIIDDYVER